MRSIQEIIEYAQRLHKADPRCTETIPVSRDEYDEVRNSVSEKKNSRFMGLTNVKILGHILKIMNEGRGA